MEFTDYAHTRTSSRFLYCSFTVISVVYALTTASILLCDNHWLLNFAVIYFLIANALTFYRASTLEPGFLPVRSVPAFNLNQVDLKGGISIIPDVLSNTRIVTFPEGAPHSYVQKYCHSCNVFRPHRASHCSDCGYCVLLKDHHCLWMNNCIGRNNHGFFYSFAFTLTVLSAYATRSAHQVLRLYPSVAIFWVCSVLIVVVGLFTAVSCVFLLYHSFIWIFNLTSREFLIRRGAVPLRLNPRGILKRMTTIRPVILQHKAAI